MTKQSVNTKPSSHASAGKTLSLPLDKLRISPTHNVRSGKRHPADIATLAAMIESQGLLNPLVVVPRSQGRAGDYDIVAGGQRFQALCLLVKQKKLARDAAIECRLTHEARATAASLAENIGRKAMHPADEFFAFKKLIDEGKSVADVAHAFGVKEITVTRRMKLASVSPYLFQLYRDDKMGLEQLMQFTLIDDHAKQESVWKTAPEWQRSPRELRRLLTVGQIRIDAPLARYVGVDAYQQAGGQVTIDLLSEAGEGFLNDGVLLEQLASVKLDTFAGKQRAAGWKWVEVRPRCGYDELARFRRVQQGLREPNEREKRKLAALQAAVTQANQELEATQGRDTPEDEINVLAEALDDAEHALNDYLDGLRAWTAEQCAVAGVIVAVGDHGKATAHCGLVRAEDYKQIKDTGRVNGHDHVGDGGGAKAKGAFSEKLTRTLTAHRNRALQALLAQRPDLALVALTGSLVPQCFEVYQGVFPTDPFKIKADPSSFAVHNAAPGIEQSPAGAAFLQSWTAWEQRLPREADEKTLFTWLQSLPADALHELLALCIASTLNTIESRPSEARPAQALAAALGADMAQWWQPTAEAFLNHVSKAQIVAAVTEAKGAEAAKALPTTKKAQLVTAAAAALQGSGWLPTPLRP